MRRRSRRRLGGSRGAEAFPGFWFWMGPDSWRKSKIEIRRRIKSKISISCFDAISRIVAELDSCGGWGSRR